VEQSLPIQESYQSPWYEKTVKDRTNWLQAGPEDITSDRKHFAAMDEFFKEDDTVLLCRIKTDGDRFKVDYYPNITTYIAIFLYT
jgi:hypothetical protein